MPIMFLLRWACMNVIMHDTITCQYIFDNMGKILENNGFQLCKFACLSTKSAANMFGRYHSIVAKRRSTIKNSHSILTIAHFHCDVYQHIYVQRFYNWQFSQLLEDMGYQFTGVPFYKEVRWLPCHGVLKRSYLLRPEIFFLFGNLR